LWFNYESPSWSEVAVGSAEEPSHSCISPIQVHPLSQAERQDDVILWLLSLHHLLIVSDIVAL